MEKYKFIKNGVDDYTLKYKDKEINFKSDVNIVTRLQDTMAAGRMKMIKDLSAQGMSIKDLTIETKKDGKTYYDNTNKIELENIYVQQEQTKVFMEIIEEKFGMGLTELFMDIGLTEEKESEEFSKQFGEILVGNFPSESTK